MLVETLYAGADNEISLLLSNASNGEPVNFISAGVTKMELTIDGQTVSSDTGEIQYFDAGKITLKLGNLAGIAALKRYPITLVAFDPLHPNGQVLIHPSMRQSNVMVDVVEV